MRKQVLSENISGQDEVKTRIPLWLYPSTIQVIDGALERSNCKSRSEFLERAALFYAGYISGEDACAYLPPAMVKAMQGTIQDSENRVCRLLFKLAVETDMLMNVLAAAIEVEPEQLKSLRGRCVQDVKKTNGSITLDKAVEYQKGENT